MDVGATLTSSGSGFTEQATREAGPGRRELPLLQRPVFTFVGACGKTSG